MTAKVITAAILAGDSYPSTPIGINLPNANWIRAAHGSKSVTLENITEAYDQASHGNGFNEEFVIDKETSDLMDKYLFIVDNMHTDLHECLGHASGKLLPGVSDDALKDTALRLRRLVPTCSRSIILPTRNCSNSVCLTTRMLTRLNTTNIFLTA